MKLALSIIILGLIILTNYTQSQDSATASIDIQDPIVGDTIRMSCTLVRQQQFRRESVDYIVNDAFGRDSSELNADSGTVGGVDASRLRASTAASDDNRVTLTGEIILSDVQMGDAVGGSIELGCVGIFGDNPEDNVNVTALASEPRAVIPDIMTATINNNRPHVGETLEVNCELFRQRGFTENMVRYIVNDAFGIEASTINENSGIVGGIPAARLEASTDSSGGTTLTGRIILFNVQESDAVDGTVRLGCVGLFGDNPGDNLNVSRTAAAPKSGSSHLSTPSIIIGSSILLSLLSPLIWL